MMRHKTLSAVFLLPILCLSCGSNSDTPTEEKKPLTQFTPPRMDPLLWGDTSGLFFSLSDERSFSEADIAATEDLIQYHEHVYRSMGSTLKHGYVPRAYLSRPSIQYIDRTAGKIPGIHKLKPVLTRIQQRCGVYQDDRKSGLNVRVEWIDKSFPSPSNAGAFYLSGALTGLRIVRADLALPPEQRKQKLGFFNHTKPEDKISLNAEGYTFEDGTQTLLDKTKGKYWEEHCTNGKDVAGCWGLEPPGFSFLDESFAHELGHAFFTEWAMSNGRSNFQTMKFREMFAELFLDICYRDVGNHIVAKWNLENEFRRSKWEDTTTRFSASECEGKYDCSQLSEFLRTAPPVIRPKEWRVKKQGHAYFKQEDILDPYQTNKNPFDMKFLAYMKAKGLWSDAERTKVFQAVLKTLEEMQGEKPPVCAPEFVVPEYEWPSFNDKFVPIRTDPHPEASKCAWGISEKLLPLSQNERPLVFTAREFYRVFEKHYPWPEEIRWVYESNRDLLNTAWEY